jgi:hypothetical protein
MNGLLQCPKTREEIAPIIQQPISAIVGWMGATQ